MKIPKLEHPIFELTLPICKKQISYRPFLVKEQKVLLLAMENSNNEDFIIKNTKQILKNCILSDIDVDDLATVDIEYLFIHLRAKSVGEIIETKYRCQNIIEGEYCNNIMLVSYDITKFDVDTSKYNDLIQSTDTIGVKMKYPTYESLYLTENLEEKEELVFDLIKTCIEYIYDEDQIYPQKEADPEELNAFIESLNIKQLKLIKEFFNNLPTINKDIEIKCEKCGFEHVITARGIGDFLD